MYIKYTYKHIDMCHMYIYNILNMMIVYECKQKKQKKLF